MFQHIEFRINKGVLGLMKEVSHKVWEFRSPSVAPHSTKSFHDLHKSLQVPVAPPTLSECCKLIELYYVLKVSKLVLFCCLNLYSFMPLCGKKFIFRVMTCCHNSSWVLPRNISEARSKIFVWLYTSRWVWEWKNLEKTWTWNFP